MLRSAEAATAPLPAAEMFLGIAAIVIAARLSAVLFRRIKQPAVVGEIIAGIVLGKSALGLLPGNLTEHLFPADVQPYLKAVAALGLVLFMFIVGLELDLKLVRGQERLATSISLSSIALPFVGGALLGLVLYASHPPKLTGDRSHLAFVLFIGASMSITAFPVLARILTDRGMLRTPLGGTALASAAVDDVVAWALLAVVVAVAGASGSADWHIWLTVPYLLVMLLAVRPALGVVARRFHAAGRLTPDVLAVVIIGVLLSAYATDWLGIHYIFGAFLFGAVMPRADTAQMFQEILERLEQVSVLLLLPVFFIVTGLSVDLAHMGSEAVWQVPLIIAVAVAGKFLGAYGAARVNHVPPHRATALGLLMNTRGLTEIVILTVGAQKGLLDQQLFSMLVLMAVVTTVMTGPLLGRVYSDRRLARDLAEAERERLGPAAYRVLVALPADGDPTPLVDVASELVAGQRPAEVAIAVIEPLPTARLEVGSGLGAELGGVVEAAERLERMRRQVEESGLVAVNLVRMSADPAAEVTAMSASVAADVVVVDARLRSQLADSLTCPVVSVRLDRPLPVGAVDLVLSSGDHGDAAAEMAVRLSVTRSAALEIRPAESTSHRRAAGFAAAVDRAGVNAAVAETAGQALTVAAYGQGVEGADIEVSADLDREPVDVPALVNRIRVDAAAS